MAYSGKYKSPSELMGDDDISREEKIEMLKQWCDDKKALLRASSEGMEGNDPSEVLRQIKKALMELGED